MLRSRIIVVGSSLLLGWASVQLGVARASESEALPHWAQTVESNWVAQELVNANMRQTPVALKTQDDAAGAVDGIKDGKWGFHTGQADNPWWQVDLGASKELSRIVVWNRCDAPNGASRLLLKLSADGQTWNTVYRHNGQVFYGFTDKKPLTVELPKASASARFVRVEFPGKTYCYLDELEVFGPENPARNLALRQPANQVSLSQWSRDHTKSMREVNWAERTRETLKYNLRRAQELGTGQAEAAGVLRESKKLTQKIDAMKERDVTREDFLQAKRLQRKLALANPLLDFDRLLFVTRKPASFNHMSDQYYGWWSQPGGGIYVLEGFKTEKPTVRCLTESFKEQGSFLRPTLSYHARKVLFAWCRYYPKLAGEPDKLNKANVPEDAFYHLFEMNLDGSQVRQLTHGKYDDFDGRYLADGRIVFLSTRRGQALQAGRETAAATMQQGDLPDCYVRCGGGPERPVAVYTLHTMEANGANICAISPFEMFEWTPEIRPDGSILYSRWDYIDRDNMPYMGLWATTPDGCNPRVIYKNFTKSPHCVFEPKPVPNSHKIVFTASGHHAQTMGSLVLLDPAMGREGTAPITRLTPEVPFPEIEAWPLTYYASPWPLSERFLLVAWGSEGMTVPGPAGWDRWHAVQRPANGMALYLFDADSGSRELLYIDPKLTASEPIPVRPRPVPQSIANTAEWEGKEGRFLLSDVYRGLKTIPRGAIKQLRIIAVPPKTHPTMNFPSLGITRDDPGKCVLGTVPVEADGSAYFRAPAGVIVLFQALDERGVALQTMRSVTHVQPGQVLGCAGCHEERQSAPAQQRTLAALREPSRITAGPSGSWPFRFDRLVQPVLDQKCVSCHQPQSKDVQAAKFDLTPARSYEALVKYGKPNLTDLVWAGYRRGYSVEHDGIAARSALLTLLSKDHYGVQLKGQDWERFVVWMDAYAQRTGAFSAEQEQDLEKLKASCAELLQPPKPVAALDRPGEPALVKH